MTSDVGMFKPILPGTVQTSPTAPAGRAEKEARAKQDPNNVHEVDKTDRADDKLSSVVSGLNDLVRDLQRELRFSIDEDSGDTVIKVIDSETDEIVRQIPSEELMRLRKHLEEAAGVIFQDSA